MAKEKTITDLSPTKRKEELTFQEVNYHAQIGFQETERRTTGKGRSGSISFNEADELFRSYVDEKNWPYDALLFDPRVFTFIFEKTSRLIAAKPKGRLSPREGSDILAAKVNNSLLDFQWDQATRGGTMLQKWALMDINARKYGASFALCKWRYETDGKDRTVFDGPEMEVLNNRDFAHDLSATSIENCNWVQVRQYVTMQELERVNDYARSKPIYKNLESLKYAIGNQEENGGLSNGGDSRGSNWTSRNRTISHLEVDPVGKDGVFKTVEIITEYRRDRWITFAPKHGIVLRDIPNPYDNYEIPVTLLKYLPIDDDLYGLSEIEPIKGLQKAINALLCQYVDEINQNLYSPIAIGPGVRQHTLEWGKGARWIMNNPMTDFRLVESRSNAAQYFNNTYSVLVSAMMNALGESSLGVSNIQPYSNDKTATEVKALQVQKNSRDNHNQLMLSEAIKRQYMLWHTMNQLLLFADPTKTNYVIRIAGDDALKYYQKRGLSDMQLQPESVAIIKEQMDIFGLSADASEEELQQTGIDLNGAFSPKYPVNIGSQKEPKVVSKMMLEDQGGGGLLYIEPSDLKGNFDFSVDVESMKVTAEEERKQAQQTAVSLLVSNPNLLGILQQEGVKPKFKELFVSWLGDLGFRDAERFFETADEKGGVGGDDKNKVEQLMKMLGASKGGQGGPAPEMNPVNPGTGANQIAKVAPEMNSPEQEQAPMGEPNPQQYQRLVNKFSEQ